jgi:hypothetical protein
LIWANAVTRVGPVHHVGREGGRLDPGLGQPRDQAIEPILVTGDQGDPEPAAAEDLRDGQAQTGPAPTMAIVGTATSLQLSGRLSPVSVQIST